MLLYYNVSLERKRHRNPTSSSPICRTDAWLVSLPIASDGITLVHDLFFILHHVWFLLRGQAWFHPVCMVLGLLAGGER